jgi:hypothetical protein
MKTEDSPEARPLDALLAIALQLRARMDTAAGIKRNLSEEAVLLRTFGFRNPDIALIIGSTPGSVAELISQAQKSKAKKAIKKGSANGKRKNK